MPGIVRLGDISTGDPCGAPPRPNNQGASKSFVNGMPIHCATHSWTPHACPKKSPHPATTTTGSSKTFVEGLPAARQGDPISCGSTCQAASGNTLSG